MPTKQEIRRLVRFQGKHHRNNTAGKWVHITIGQYRKLIKPLMDAFPELFDYRETVGKNGGYHREYKFDGDTAEAMVQQFVDNDSELKQLMIGAERCRKRAARRKQKKYNNIIGIKIEENDEKKLEKLRALQSEYSKYFDNDGCLVQTQKERYNNAQQKNIINQLTRRGLWL